MYNPVVRGPESPKSNPSESTLAAGLEGRKVVSLAVPDAGTRKSRLAHIGTWDCRCRHGAVAVGGVSSLLSVG